MWLTPRASAASSPATQARGSQGRPSSLPAKATKAKADLDGYRADFGALLNSVNPNLPKEAVAEALIPHVTATFAAIDGVVAGDGTGFEKLRVAAGHMPNSTQP